MDYNCCDMTQKTLHRAPAFDSGFYLNRLVAS